LQNISMFAMFTHVMTFGCDFVKLGLSI